MGIFNVTENLDKDWEEAFEKSYRVWQKEMWSLHVNPKSDKKELKKLHRMYYSSDLIDTDTTTREVATFYQRAGHVMCYHLEPTDGAPTPAKPRPLEADEIAYFMKKDNPIWRGALGTPTDECVPGDFIKRSADGFMSNFVLLAIYLLSKEVGKKEKKNVIEFNRSYDAVNKATRQPIRLVFPWKKDANLNETFENALA